LASAALVRGWVSYAEANCGPGQTKAVNDCTASGVVYCDAVQYLDTNWIYPGSPPIANSAAENWWLHDPGYSDSGHRIVTNDGTNGKLLNQLNTGVDGWMQNYARANYNNFAGLMMDDMVPTLGGELYYTAFSSTNEITSSGQLLTGHEQIASYMTHSNGAPFLQIQNGLQGNPWLTTPFSMINDHTGVEGFVSENSPYSNGVLTNYYAGFLDEIAYIDSTPDDFIVMLSYSTGSALQGRLIQQATEMLGYSGNHLVDWADLEKNTTNLSVWPEEGIVPTNPLQSMSAPSGSGCLGGNGGSCTSGGHNSIQVASGVYRREFSQCYNQGVAIGPCAAIVNANGGAVTVQSSWLTQSYHHQVTFNGGDVQSGGSINVSGGGFTAGSTTIPGADAILLTS
jgi:hypothetical protein